MIAADGEEFNHRDAIQLAEAAADAQVSRVVAAIRQVASSLPAPPGALVFSGHGEFLALKALEDLPPVGSVLRLSQLLDPAVSRCASAHALAVLAREAIDL
jgi:uncharacterized hydantoinase/oxoprolinase family protein